MPDTLNLQQRYEASNIIQRSLAQDPFPEAGKQYWLGMDRAEAISMIGTLRGHDTLDLGDKVRAALERTGGELSLVVTDVFRRMDTDEFDEFICHLTSSINNEPPTDLDEELSRGELSMGGIEQLLDKVIETALGNASVGSEQADDDGDATPGAVHLSEEGIPSFGIGEFDHYPTRAEIEERLERLFPGFAEHFAGDIHVRREEPSKMGDTIAGRDPGDEDRVQVRRTLLMMTPRGVVEVTGAERDEIFRALGVG